MQMHNHRDASTLRCVASAAALVTRHEEWPTLICRCLRHNLFLSDQKRLIVASGYQDQSISVLPELDIVVARFGLTAVQDDWDLASLLVDVISALQ
jgi:hypothetical protein